MLRGVIQCTSGGNQQAQGEWLNVLQVAFVVSGLSAARPCETLAVLVPLIHEHVVAEPQNVTWWLGIAAAAVKCGGAALVPHASVLEEIIAETIEHKEKAIAQASPTAHCSHHERERVIRLQVYCSVLLCSLSAAPTFRTSG